MGAASIGLNYQSWVDTSPVPAAAAQVTPLRARATMRAAMTVLSVFDGALLIVVVAAMGLSLAQWWLWAALVGAEGSLVLTGHYRRRITLNVAREAGSLASCAAAPFLVLALARVPGPSTVRLITTAAIAATSLVIARCGQYWLMRVMRTRGWFGERTLFIGAGKVSAQMASTLDKHPEYGLRPIGFLDEVESEGLALPLFGGVDALRMVLRQERIDRVVVGFGVTREADMINVFRACEDASIEIHVLPRLFELAMVVNRGNVDDVWGYPLLRLRRSLMRRNARFIKRVFDASLAALALLLVLPLYAAIAAAVKLSSPGPIHFRQERVGEHDVIVNVLKFRSMRVNARSDVEWNPLDDGVTTIGRVLRVTGLDELPQLWNIVKGDMSFVGPRPERPYFVEQFRAGVPRYEDRHRVPAGLTGLAQIHGLRGDTSIDERARLDNQYIENWTLWSDIVILVQTFSAVIRNTLAPSRAKRAVAIPTSRLFPSGTTCRCGGEHLPLLQGNPFGSTGRASAHTEDSVRERISRLDGSPAGGRIGQRGVSGSVR